ncbi:MAG: hypothetical protein DLM66_12625 [Candidatus Dormiibacter spiritus]|nr:MAG: hypothetical protein DLM66_12625 [Candidatus Dormibacteraeota bacterium]
MQSASIQSAPISWFSHISTKARKCLRLMMTVLETSSRGSGFVSSATLRLTGPSRMASLSMFLSTSRTRLQDRDLRAFGVVFALPSWSAANSPSDAVA